MDLQMKKTGRMSGRARLPTRGSNDDHSASKNSGEGQRKYDDESNIYDFYKNELEERKVGNLSTPVLSMEDKIVIRGLHAATSEMKHWEDRVRQSKYYRVLVYYTGETADDNAADSSHGSRSKKMEQVGTR